MASRLEGLPGDTQGLIVRSLSANGQEALGRVSKQLEAVVEGVWSEQYSAVPRLNERLVQAGVVNPDRVASRKRVAEEIVSEAGEIPLNRQEKRQCAWSLEAVQIAAESLDEYELMGLIGFLHYVPSESLHLFLERLKEQKIPCHQKIIEVKSWCDRHRASLQSITTIRVDILSMQELSRYITPKHHGHWLRNMGPLPDLFAHFTNLEMLELKGALLTTLPPSLISSRITRLNLEDNQMDVSFRSSLWNMTFLENLSLKNNSIRELSSNISRLVSLTTLDLSGNPIEKLPRELLHFRSLRTVDLRGTNVTFLEIFQLVQNAARSNRPLTLFVDPLISEQKIHVESPFWIAQCGHGRIVLAERREEISSQPGTQPLDS